VVLAAELLHGTFVNRRAMASVNVAIVQELAEHSSISTTPKHCAWIVPDSLRDAQSRLAFGNVISIVSNSYHGPETDEAARKVKVIRLYMLQ
jgi:hypothetical protein